jgi:regulatory protein
VARSIALDRIAARDRTRHELAKALHAKNVPSEVADQVLDRLQEVGLVNDAAFAEAWVESRQQRRHLSRPALRRELQAKGVDRDQIDAALESVDYGDELAAARELARRRHAAIAGLSYPVRYRRLAGALSRRGFGSAIVHQVLREVLGEE